MTEAGKFQWEGIIVQVLETFVDKETPWQSLHWAWQYFIEPKCSLQIEKPWKYLHRLVNSDEVVWFMAEESSEKVKYWVYEGNVKAIAAVLDETVFFEYYLVSKKFRWLLCENHQGMLIGTGKKLCYKIKKLKEDLK